MTPQQAFKAAYLRRMASSGVGPEEAVQMAKQALHAHRRKQASIPGIVDKIPFIGPVLGEGVEAIGRMGSSVIGATLPMAMTAGGLALVGAPLAGGAIAGHLAAEAQDDDTDVDAAQADETIRGYEQLAREAKQRAELRRLAQKG